MRRYGGTDAVTSVKIDEMGYTYQPNSNKLAKIVDYSNSTQGFKDSTTNTVDDYQYDLYGNMTKDNNKGITNITYNHLNLPLQVTFSATQKINYIYNAAGVKVKKEVTNGSTITTTDYLAGGFQYSNAGA